MKSKQGMLTLYKNRGETPLECLERFKKVNPEYESEKMTYAGRLDPLAEGLLLVLAGEECKNKDKYLGLNKIYEVDVLFGFSTDTYDILGKVLKNKIYSSGQIPDKNLLKSFVGKFFQKYPAYSSRYFNKARSGELKDEEITEKEVEIKDIKIIGQKAISKNDLEKYIFESISLVKGDFRQNEILENWKEELLKSEMNDFSIISIKVDCTSGTYMRSLANSIGEKIGIPSLALNIKRVKVGGYKI
jgi:tRNA pseudouridine55 synthase